MVKSIRKVTVLGAGTMGSGIAAQLANAGIEVNLLDIVPKGAEDRNVVAKSAIERMKKASLNPAADPMSGAFMTPANAKFVKPGNMEDDLEAAVKDCDWFIEVIPENLELKRSVFAKVDEALNPGTIVTSNTSTIPLHDLVEGRSENFTKNFAITHFFNPPRFMKLLEIVSGKGTDAEVTETLDDFCDKALGRKVIHCNDTPAFIGNRIGTYFMFKAIADAAEKGIPVNDADTVLSRPLELADKSGPFKVLDLVGLQLVPGLQKELDHTLPSDDPFRKIDSGPSTALINKMIEEGRTGRKSGKGGFYNVVKEGGKKTYLSVNLQTGEYEPYEKHGLAVVDAAKAAVKAGESPSKAVFETGDELSDYAWGVMRDTILYAASRIPEIADNVLDVDDAMHYGYDWKKGPFQILDKMGAEWFVERVRAEGLEVPPILEHAAQGNPFYKIEDGKVLHMTYDGESFGYETAKHREGVIDLKEIARTSEPLITHNGASLWDIGDGIVCFELHSMKNTIDPTVIHVLNESIKLVKDNPDKYKGMVLYNDSDQFSVGANLGLIDEMLKYEKMSLAELSEKELPGTLKKGFKLPLIGRVSVPGWAAKALTKSVEKVAGWIDNAKDGDWVRKPLHDHFRKKVSDMVYGQIGDMIYQGQSVYQALREAPFPVVGAPNGYAFGGGCEMLLHCDAIQAQAETYTGLVEAGVGVIPGWGGCARTLERAFNAQAAGKLPGGPMPPAMKVFEALMNPLAAVSTSAQDAKSKLWLNPDDGVTFNRERLLGDAKAKALELSDGYEAPKPATFHLPGKTAATAFRMGVDGFYATGLATYHDVVVGDALGDILSGGDTHIGLTLTESDIKQLEREAFMSLIHTPETQARVAKMARENGFIREKDPEGNPTLKEIRANRESMTLPHKEVTGQPLEGTDAKKLKASANMVGKILSKMHHPEQRLNL